MEANEEILTLDDVCGMLRCSRSTMYRILARGKGSLPHFRVGTDYRFQRAKVEDWMRRGGTVDRNDTDTRIGD